MSSEALVYTDQPNDILRSMSTCLKIKELNIICICNIERWVLMREATASSTKTVQLLILENIKIVQLNVIEFEFSDQIERMWISIYRIFGVTIDAIRREWLLPFAHHAYGILCSVFYFVIKIRDPLSHQRQRFVTQVLENVPHFFVRKYG